MSGTGCHFPGRLLTALLLALKPQGAEELGSALHPTAAHHAPGAFRAAPWGGRCPRPRHSGPGATRSFPTHPLDVRRSGVFHSEPRLAAALPRTHGAGAPLALLAGFAAAPHRRHPTRGWTRDTPASRRAEGHSFIKGACPRESLWHAGPFPGGGKASGKPNLGKIPQSLFERLETTRRVIYRL